ncbi:lytic transglycosylase domain-containing protein [Serratia fonticola]|uniref:lytic transglycosylase domain-containing protein n=1 Tax=Serratia fonticola TaxID=47917 RepID=UPI00093B8F78|nr:lytic transglycosylase domain-containing protein [Serratia fonticola]OKP31364.1 hypothetical protein BSQ40_00435 [Serratia fonticola]
MSENIPVITIPVDNEQLKEALSLIERLSEAAEKFNSKYGSPLGGGVGGGWGGVPPGGVGGGGCGCDGKGKGKDDKDKGFLNGVNKLAKAAEKSFDQVNKTIGKTVGMLKGLFESAISWGLKIALLGTGSSFGYGLIAKNAGRQLSDAQANKMTTGQMQAAKNVYGNRFSDVDNVIQGLTDAQRIDSPYRPGIMALGLDPNASPGENIPLYYQKVADMAARDNGSGLAYTEISKLKLEGMTSLNAFNQIAANHKEVPGYNRQYEATSHKLEMSENVGRGLQDVTTTLDTTTDKIFNSFKTALSNLNGPIKELSNTFSDAVDSFLNGENGKYIFTELGNGIKKFSEWIGNKDFQKDMGEFSRAVMDIVKAIGRAVIWIGGMVGGNDQKEGETDAEYQARKQKERSDALAKAKNDSSFNKATPATPTTLAVPAREGSGNRGFWAGVKAVGQTAGGIITTIGKNIFPDLDERWKGGGWYNHQLTKDEPVQHAQRTKKPVGKRSASWHDYSQLESQHGLKPNFLSAVEQVESNGNPWAIGPMTKYGQAKGAFQFMDPTAAEMGLRGGEVFDREKSATAAAKYFAKLSKKYDGDPVMMLAAYNWGQGNLDKHGLAKMPDETRRYLEKILPQIGESGQLARIQQSNADSRIVAGGQQSRLVIDVALNQAPGSDINAQIRSNMPPPINIPF